MLESLVNKEFYAIISCLMPENVLKKSAPQYIVEHSRHENN